MLVILYLLLLPMSTLEATSYGLSLILSNIDAHQELINNGEIFVNNNLESIKNIKKPTNKL